MEPSIVYVKTDKQNRIIAVDGGYTTPTDLSGWVKIDEGYGDKYNLCQSHYVSKPLYAYGSVPQYKLEDGKVVERSAEEIEADRLQMVRENKTVALSAICQQTIYAGQDIELSDGTTEHYEYKALDQTNIKSMFDSVTNLGITEFPYQSEDGSCRVYSAADIITIYTSLEGLRISQLTYYHQIKEYVATLATVEEIEAVTYGQPLTGDYLTHYNDMVAVAMEQMQQAIQRRVTANG